MKNLEIMGVQEMDAKEMRNENGGWADKRLPTLKSDSEGSYLE